MLNKIINGWVVLYCPLWGYGSNRDSHFAGGVVDDII